MAKELDNVIKVENDFYEVTATKANRVAKRDKVVTDLRSVYNDINNLFLEYLEKHNVDEETKTVVTQYMDYQTGLIDIMNQQEGLPSFDKEAYISEKNKAIQDIVESAKEEYFNLINSEARKAGLMSYEEWSKQDFINKLDRRARNNYILDRMIKIMQDDTSREEQYGRSKFDDITAANKLIDKI